MGQSRVPAYEEAEVPASAAVEVRNKGGSIIATLPSSDRKTMKVKRIIGIYR